MRPENISPERPLRGLATAGPVLSPSCITCTKTTKKSGRRMGRTLSVKASGGGNGPEIQPSLVDAALICKEFLSFRHVIECGLLSGLFTRPDRVPLAEMVMRGPGPNLQQRARSSEKVSPCPTRIMSIMCPFGSCLPHNSAARLRCLLPDQAAQAITGSR